MTLKKLLGSLALGAILVAPFGKTLHAATTSGSTQLKVTLPDIIILHYISDIHLNFATDISDNVDEGGNASTWTTAWNGTNSEGDELAQGTTLGSPSYELEGTNSTINVTLNDVWAIRGISSDGTASVSISGVDNLTNTQSDTIGISDWKVTDGTITADASITGVPLNGIPKSTATLGDVNLTLDLGAAHTSGDYTNSAAEYTITAETI